MQRRRLWSASVLVIVLAGTALVATRAAFSQTRALRKQQVVHFPPASPQAAYSSAVLAGDTLYLSGVLGLDSKTGKPPETIDDEIKIVLDTYKTTLGRAGFVMDDLVNVQVYCTDLSYYDKFNAAYRTYFSKELPARAFVGVNSLIGGGHVEMQAIAVRH